MHFIHKTLCFEEFLHKIALFFKKKKEKGFLEFWLIKPVSWLIKIAIKVLVWFYVFRSMLDWFWINQRYFRLIESKFWSIENRIESFLKTFVSHVFFTIQNFFKTPFSLSSIVQGVKASFCHFPSKFLQGFSLSRPVRPYCPSFFIYFQFSCI